MKYAIKTNSCFYPKVYTKNDITIIIQKKNGEKKKVNSFFSPSTILTMNKNCIFRIWRKRYSKYINFYSLPLWIQNGLTMDDAEKVHYNANDKSYTIC